MAMHTILGARIVETHLYPYNKLLYVAYIVRNSEGRRKPEDKDYGCEIYCIGLGSYRGESVTYLFPEVSREGAKKWAVKAMVGAIVKHGSDAAKDRERIEQGVEDLILRGIEPPPPVLNVHRLVRPVGDPRTNPALTVVGDRVVSGPGYGAPNCVAVLYSDYEHWSTRDDNADFGERLLFEPDLVYWVLAKPNSTRSDPQLVARFRWYARWYELLETLFPEKQPKLTRPENLRIDWVPIGEEFVVEPGEGHDSDEGDWEFEEVILRSQTVPRSWVTA